MSSSLHETTYPALFSVLTEDRASSEPVTNNLLTYVKTSPDAGWKLASSSDILGPTDAGVAVPPPRPTLRVMSRVSMARPPMGS